uniref:Uncharacterized protein n=1 Tax=Palpitomonas bilix TaxID=652834 RepID=A0A7S3G1D0_9EUKA|mmetsp:Transcript_20781/g.53598  ORF Transcript_20781/g.53598 Transcript_20781/m.53598 type:complete len:788 (+) Transcript_20781:214-2577(+)
MHTNHSVESPPPSDEESGDERDELHAPPITARKKRMVLLVIAIVTLSAGLSTAYAVVFGGWQWSSDVRDLVSISDTMRGRDTYTSDTPSSSASHSAGNNEVEVQVQVQSGNSSVDRVMKVAQTTLSHAYCACDPLLGGAPDPFSLQWREGGGGVMKKLKAEGVTKEVTFHVDATSQLPYLHSSMFEQIEGASYMEVLKSMSEGEVEVETGGLALIKVEVASPIKNSRACADRLSSSLDVRCMVLSNSSYGGNRHSTSRSTKRENKEEYASVLYLLERKRERKSGLTTWVFGMRDATSDSYSAPSHLMCEASGDVFGEEGRGGQDMRTVLVVNVGLRWTGSAQRAITGGGMAVNDASSNDDDSVVLSSPIFSLSPSLFHTEGGSKSTNIEQSEDKNKIELSSTDLDPLKLALPSKRVTFIGGTYAEGVFRQAAKLAGSASVVVDAAYATRTRVLYSSMHSDVAVEASKQALSKMMIAKQEGYVNSHRRQSFAASSGILEWLSDRGSKTSSSSNSGGKVSDKHETENGNDRASCADAGGWQVMKAEVEKRKANLEKRGRELDDQIKMVTERARVDPLFQLSQLGACEVGENVDVYSRAGHIDEKVKYTFVEAKSIQDFVLLLSMPQLSKVFENTEVFVVEVIPSLLTSTINAPTYAAALHAIFSMSRHPSRSSSGGKGVERVMFTPTFVPTPASVPPSSGEEEETGSLISKYGRTSLLSTPVFHYHSTASSLGAKWVDGTWSYLAGKGSERALYSEKEAGERECIADVDKWAEVCKKGSIDILRLLSNM